MKLTKWMIVTLVVYLNFPSVISIEDGQPSEMGIMHPEAMSNMYQQMVEHTFDRFLLQVSTGIETFLNLSHHCHTSLTMDTVESKRWLIQMLDASGKPPSGITQGNMYWLGNFWQCLNAKFDIEQPLDGDDSQRPQTSVAGVGEYCLVKLHLPGSQPQTSNNEKAPAVNMAAYYTIKWGVCVPSTCNLQDKKTLLRHYTNYFGIESTIEESNCQTAQWRAMDLPAKFLTVLLLAPFCFVLMATICDYWHQVTRNSSTNDASECSTSKRKEMCHGFCQIFSARITFMSLFSFPKVSGRDTLTFLYGIRVLVLFTVIIWGHYIVAMATDFPLTNGISGLQLLSLPWCKTIHHQFLMMNIYFYLTGFCLSYTTSMRYNSSGTTVSIAKMYLGRYARINIPYLFVIAFITGPFIFLWKGPLWPRAEYLHQGCRQEWWKQMSYTKSLIGAVSADRCVLGEWYLTVDMQLYAIAVPLVWLLIRKRGLGIICIIGMVVMSVASVAILISVYNYPMHLSSTTAIYKGLTEVFRDSEERRMCYRASSLGFGLLAGYILSQHNFNTESFKNFIYGFTSVGLSAIMITVTGNVYIDGRLMPQLLQLIYGTIGNLLWCAALTWIIIYCNSVPQGWLNKLLSWRGFILLGKMSYSVFLVHGTVLTYQTNAWRESLPNSSFLHYWEYVNFSVFSICAAIPLYFMVESPSERIIHHCIKNS